MSTRIKDRIEAYFIEHGPMRGSEVRCKFNISKSLWGTYMHELCGEGRLVKVGEDKVKGQLYPVYAPGGQRAIDEFLARPVPQEDTR